MYSSKISFYDYVFHVGCPGNKFFDADENCICPAGLSDNGDYCGKFGVWFAIHNGWFCSDSFQL